MKIKTFSKVLTFVLAGSGFFQSNAQTYTTRSRIHEAVDDSRRVALKGQTHPLAVARFDRGVAPLDLEVDRIVLVMKRSPEQQQALDQLLEEQQDQASANYRKWLTPEEFGERFGASAEDLQAVSSWLMSQGFQVNEVAKGRMLIEFSGTAERVRNAFRTEIHKYLVNGVEHWANQSDPQIPAALAPVVEGVASLHDFRFAPQLHEVAPLTNLSSGNHALSPADYAAIYNIKPAYASGITGAGATIAVVGRSNIDPQDVADFRKYFGLAANPAQIIVNGADPGIVKGVEQSEATLDVTWAGAVAPGAAVKFVVSKSTSATDGILLSAKYIVDNNLADVMTESFGGCEATYSASAASVLAVAQQAAAQGITFLVSTGDSGAADCDASTATKATHAIGVNYLASTPYTVAVGGSQFDDTANSSKYWAAQNGTNRLSALSYIPEVVWNESCDASQAGCSKAELLSTGGGASILYGKPSWQAGVPGIPNDGRRDLPDVSLTAAVHDPYIICLGGSCRAAAPTFSLIGGTSAAAPSFAGIMALVRQKTGVRQGQANTVLYSLAARQAYSQCNGSAGAPASSCVFNDITTGTNAVPGASGYAATPGYDLATGLGSVNVSNLLNQWTSAKYSPTTTTLNISPANIPAGGSATVSVTVSSQSGKPTGSVALVSSAGQTLATLTLSGGTSVVNISNWPTGTYTVTANYAGDAVYAPSKSAPVSITSAAATSSQPEVTSVTPGQVKANQTVTLTVNGRNFQTGLTAYIYLDGNYYLMSPSSVTATQVKFGVVMGGPGPYTAYVVIRNPGGLQSYVELAVTN